MCLKNLGPEREYDEFPAFKVVGKRCSDDIWRTGPYSKTPLERGVWLQATNEPALKIQSDYYGFCVFRYEADAREWCRTVSFGIAIKVVPVTCKGKCRRGDVLDKWDVSQSPLPAAYVEYIKFNMEDFE